MRKIGQGGMGIVYEAVQESLGRRVALKVLLQNRSMDESQKRRFAQEARAAARLHHTNIVPVFGVGEQDGVYYYVMQLIPGWGLDHMLDRLRETPSGYLSPTGTFEGSSRTPPLADSHSPATIVRTTGHELAGSTVRGALSDPGLPPGDDPFRGNLSVAHFASFRDIARLGMQAAEALQHAHEHGVPHRDIKPSNLLLDCDGKIWITDFGLGKGLVLSETDRRLLRNEAIAALALPDLSMHGHWHPRHRTMILDAIDFDPGLQRYTVVQGDALNVCQVTDNAVAAVLRQEDSTVVLSRFSPDGRLLGVGYERPGGHAFVLWDWAAAQPLFKHPGGVWKLSLDFHPDCRSVAVGQMDGVVRVLDCSDGKVAGELCVGEAPFSVRWNPAGDVLAIACTDSSVVTLWNPHSNQVMRRTQHAADEDVLGIAWHPRGQQLAVACDQSIHLWDLDRPDRPRAVLEGHTFLVHNIEYHPDGNHLVSHGWEGKSRFWDARLGQQVLAIDGHFTRFSADGGRLAFRTGSHLGIWQVACGIECVQVYGTLLEPGLPSGITIGSAFHPRLPLIAATSDVGLRIWETDTFREVAATPEAPVEGVSFDPRDGSVLLYAETGPQRFPLEGRVTSAGIQVTLGKPERIGLPPETWLNSAAHDARGDVLAVVLRREGRALVFRDRGSEPVVLRGQPRMALVAVSPDGQWAVTGNQNYPGFEVWNTASGERVKELPAPGTGIATFSPDGRWVVTADGEKYQFWGVPSWEAAHAVPRRDVPTGGYLAAGAAAFSADSRLLAVASNQYLVQLIDARTGEEIASLEQTPNPTLVNWLAFSSDNRQLAVCCGTEGLCVWNLDLLRRQLAALGLDWAW